LKGFYSTILPISKQPSHIHPFNTILIRMQSHKEWDNEIIRLRKLVNQKDNEIQLLREENVFLKREFNYFIQLIQEAEGMLYGYKPPRLLQHDPKIQYISLSNQLEYKQLFQVLKPMNSFHSF